MSAVADAVQVAAIYTAFFNRAPDADGLEFWIGQFEQGATVLDLSAGFAGHSVFEATYGGLDDRAFVEAIYWNVLGSAGDRAGLEFWTDTLAAGAMTRDQMVGNFVHAALHADLDSALAGGELTQIEYDQAVIRQQALLNRAEVGVTFANTFGELSNLSPETDPQSLPSLQLDPAWLVSQVAIAGVTHDIGTRQVALDQISSAAAAIAQMDRFGGELVPLAQLRPGEQETVVEAGTAQMIDGYLFNVASFDIGDTIRLTHFEPVDALFVGAHYQWGGPSPAAGDDALLEIFASQAGEGVLLQLETHAAASSQPVPALIDIVLTGVTLADLQLKEGFITL